MKTTKIGRYTVEDSWGNYNPEEDIIAQDLIIYELRAARTILEQVNNPGGDVFKYARKALGLTISELAKYFKEEESVVRGWESGQVVKFPKIIQYMYITLLKEAENNNGDLPATVFRYSKETAPNLLRVK